MGKTPKNRTSKVHNNELKALSLFNHFQWHNLAYIEKNTLSKENAKPILGSKLK